MNNNLANNNFNRSEALRNFRLTDFYRQSLGNKGPITGRASYLAKQGALTPNRSRPLKCAYIRQRAQNIAGGKILFSVYNLALRDTKLGRFLDRLNLEPAHDYISLSRNLNIGFSKEQGVAIESAADNFYSDSTCYDATKVAKALPKVHASKSTYRLLSSNCQDYVEKLMSIFK